MENIVYNELVKRGYSVDVGVVTERKKDENGFYHCNLIDFLLEENELF